MKKVQITCGIYGYRAPGEQNVTAITSADGVIELPNSEADRLVRRGVAEYAVDKTASAPVATTTEGDDGAKAGVNTLSNVSPPTPHTAPANKPVYNADSNVDVLRKIGKTVGISFKPGTTKVAMAEQLDAFFMPDTTKPVTSSVTADDTDDDEQPPIFGAEEPVV